MSAQLTEPNLRLPLAASYNTRGIDAFTNVFTNALDQRKVNSIYEPVTNALSGKTTLYLCKRPGFELSNETFGTSGQVAYLIHVFADLNAWVFNVSSDAVRASNSSGTNTTIVTEASRVPIYVDATRISDVETVVLQTAIAQATQKVYYASVIDSWTEITDSVFTGLTHRGKMEHLGGYAHIMDHRGRIYSSSLNTLATWPASSYITKQIMLDAERGLMKFKNQLLAFGYESCEVFEIGGGGAGSPLISIPGRQARVGIPTQPTGGNHYAAIMGERLYFVGNQSSVNSTRDGLFAYNGQEFGKVSTPAIDKILASSTPYSVHKCSIRGQEAIAISLDLTTAATQRWLMYFPKWNDWFEWNSTVATPVNHWNVYLGVGSNQHRVYFVRDTDTFQDDATNYAWTHQFQIPKDGNHEKFMAMCGLVGDTARSAQSIAVSTSDDDGQNWVSLGNIDMTSKDKALFRCGSYTERQMRMAYTGSLDVRLEQFVAQVHDE